MTALSLAALLSGVGFVLYGIQCLSSRFMLLEFERFGQSRFRVLTGVLEILGGLGVLIGIRIPALGIFSASGLCILMAMGVVVRVRIGDRPLQIAPAFFFALLNSGIVILHLLSAQASP
jgi:hypothetical protein